MEGKLFTNRAERQKFYHSVEWRNLREYILAHEPFCRRCKALGVITPATECDHIRDITDDPENCLNVDAIQPLCKKCHSRKTAKKLFKNNNPKSKEKQQQKLFNRKWKIE